MSEEEIKNLLTKLEDHEIRIQSLEKLTGSSKGIDLGNKKQKTLREIVKGRKFKNGQEQIAVIVGYHENIIDKPINKNDIKTEWDSAKITNKYNKTFLQRAKDDLIRIHPDGSCDLTQTGEEFFEAFLKDEPIKPTLK